LFFLEDCILCISDLDAVMYNQLPSTVAVLSKA
jgi:hypothetical protein